MSAHTFKAPKLGAKIPGGAEYKLSKSVLDLVWLERLRQMALLRDGKLTWNCATAGISHDKKLRAIMEEVGEVAQAIDDIENLRCTSSVDHHRKYRAAMSHLREEITQIAACSIAWLEALEVER